MAEKIQKFNFAYLKMKRNQIKKGEQARLQASKNNLLNTAQVSQRKRSTAEASSQLENTELSVEQKSSIWTMQMQSAELRN
jgi:hypothetical protein